MRPHSGNWEFAQVPWEMSSWEEAGAWARATLGPQARVSRSAWRGSDGGPAQALIDRSRPPGIASPMISVLQLHARDVSGLPFPEGTDCFHRLTEGGNQVPMAGTGWTTAPIPPCRTRLTKAFAFDERRQLGEVSIVCSRACSAYLAEACTGRPEHLPDGGHISGVMGTWPAEP